jgi:hypothetical protein
MTSQWDLSQRVKLIEMLPASDQRPLLRAINAYFKGAKRKQK